jgi:hypothetical protein
LVPRALCTWRTFTPEGPRPLVGWCASPGQIPNAATPRQRAGERWSKMTLDGEPPGMRSSRLSYTMALAETTVVETVSEAGRRCCPGQRCCSKPTSSQRGQELGGCDDEKYATMGQGIAALVMI